MTSVKTTRDLRMGEEDKNTEEVAGSNDSNWVSKELGKEEDDEEGELLEGALNIFIGPESNHCLALLLSLIAVI